MMDIKTLQEIKRRVEQGVYQAPYAPYDICMLIGEVERLKKDRDDLKALIDMYGGGEGITSALQEAVDCRKETAAANLEKAKLQEQIATLEKALELACAELNISDVEKVFAPDYFIHQAQEQCKIAKCAESCEDCGFCEGQGQEGQK